ncbi:MAG TPA: hypothetical protein VGO59_18310 [Verrucomicrobiae bacterium]|jgi:hypothetical protein
MAWQLIYTSAPRGLLSGQSGFCTVARNSDLREALVPRLEQISSYHYLRVAEAATAGRNPVISAFRVLDLRGAKYYVLTRIQPCGLDFTARTNHLAHHLIFQAEELARLPSPASILRRWPGWLASWQGEPRLLGEVDAASLAAAGKNSLPAQTWAALTGDAGRAAGLLESECVRGCYLLSPAGSEEQVLQMYCETLQLLNLNGQFPLRPWRHTFTSFLQAEDNPNDFQWRACQENTPAWRQALTRSAPMLALRSVRLPANDLVKKAREPSRPPPPPPAALPAANDPPAPEQRPALRLRRDAGGRDVSSPPPMVENVRLKRPAGQPGFRVHINSATLAGLGIFAAVLVVLALIKSNSGNRAAEQGRQPPPAEPKSSSAVEPPPKAPADDTAAADAKSLDDLVGDGPTYILAAANVSDFTLPIDSIVRLQNLLHRYDHLDLVPGDIHLTVAADHWDSPPGAPMNVAARTNECFAASTPGLECRFDYANWLASPSAPLRCHASFKPNAPHAFSMHFGFSASAGGDPFRLLIVNKTNPPHPLRLARTFVLDNHQEVDASLARAMRECLKTNFTLLTGHWQLQPWLQGRVGGSRYLYQDWPPNETPLFGCELDFDRIAKRLQAQGEGLEQKEAALAKPLGAPLGAFLETNADLASFPAYASNNLTAKHFLDYLAALREAAPKKSWIKKWHDDFDSGQPEAVAGRLQELYNIWTDAQPANQAMLTVACAGGTTNYFFGTWRSLKELEETRDRLDLVRKRQAEMEQVGFVALCIADPARAGEAVKMIRFEGP